MNYKFDIVDKYDRKFIKLNDDIKNIEILLSFATPEHLLYKMTITKDSEGKYNVNVKKGDVPHDWYRDWTRKREGKKKETKE